MITLITGLPCRGKTCLAIENALKQSKPVYTNIIDNTAHKSFLPKSFKLIPDSDWTLIDEPAYIIYDACEYLEYFTARFKRTDHRLQGLLTHRHLGHDIVFIFQHEKFAHPLIREVSEHIHLLEYYYSRPPSSDL